LLAKKKKAVSNKKILVEKSEIRNLRF
jgi:hypothetical protein